MRNFNNYETDARYNKNGRKLHGRAKTFAMCSSRITCNLDDDILIRKLFKDKMICGVAL